MAQEQGRTHEANQARDAAITLLWCSKYWDYVTRVCSRLLPREAVEDVVQEVWANVCKALLTFRGDHDEASLKLWLHTIAKVCIGAYYRKLELERNHLKTIRCDRKRQSAQPRRGDNSPEHNAMERQMGALVIQALEMLSPPDKEVLILAFQEGRSIAEIADELQIKRDAVRQRLLRAKRRLEHIVQKLPEDGS
jgi:RNA polymerase sigma factor (sigma-70 family)